VLVVVVWRVGGTAAVQAPSNVTARIAAKTYVLRVVISFFPQPVSRRPEAAPRGHGRRQSTERIRAARSSRRASAEQCEHHKRTPVRMPRKSPARGDVDTSGSRCAPCTAIARAGPDERLAASRGRLRARQIRPAASNAM
jgi:hypothetical protein